MRQRAVVSMCSMLTLACCDPVSAAAPFTEWLDALRAEAAVAGISSGTLDLALDGLTPEPRVLELQRRQPESRQRFDAYLRIRVSPKRIAEARERMAKHSDLLQEVAATYHVQPRFIVALWGLESDFGRNTGNWPTVQSLATLAHQGRRSAYFRRELIAALRLVEAMPERSGMTGSWAGAVGQCQFMPSNVTALAVDHDRDGRVDVWQALPDVFASIAHFLSRHGWHDDQTWGREAFLPANFDERLEGHDVRMKLRRWQLIGVRRADGRDLPSRRLWGSILIPDGLSGPAFLVYEDFLVLLKWNRSDHFALAVGSLSDQLR